MLRGALPLPSSTLVCLRHFFTSVPTSSRSRGRSGARKSLQSSKDPRSLEAGCQSWSRVHRCDCLARERRDNLLMAQGKLTITGRLKEEALVFPEETIPQSESEKKKLPPEEFPENMPGAARYRLEGCKIPKCDCQSREKKADAVWAKGPTSITRRLTEDDLQFENADWSDIDHKHFPLNRPKDQPKAS